MLRLLRLQQSDHFWRTTTALVLGAVVALIYGRSVGYGLMWDDPVWFRQGAGLSIGELLRGTERYQFYRPLSLAYFQLWWRADGALAIRGMHAAEVGWHLLATWLVVALGRAWRADRLTAALAGLLFALFPFSQQAVVWAAPQQPMVTALLLAAVLAFMRCLPAGRDEPPVAAGDAQARRLPNAPDELAAAAGDAQGERPASSRDDVAGVRRRTAWFLVAVVIYAAALFVQEAALPFALLFFLTAWWRSRARGLVWALPFALLGIGYVVLWWLAPRLGGIAGDGFDTRVAAFVLQAAAFPLARAVAGPVADPPPLLLAALLGAAWALAILVVVRSGSRALAALATAWTALALLPVWAGLPWSYVELGPRLVYPAVPGIALLWAVVAGAFLRHRRRLVRWATAVVVAAVVVVAASDVRAQNRAAAAGAAHLDEAIAAGADPARRAVFINFPDRYELRESPYPLGFWGVTLAPVVVEIADFARAATGHAGTTASWSVPATGHDDRAAWPYRVDMRGVIVDAGRLLEVTDGADVYLSDYLPAGGLRLRRVGGWPVAGADDGVAPTRPLAVLGDAVAVQRAEIVDGGGGEFEVRFDWRRLGPLDPDDTVFVHVFAPDGRQVLGADGDAWGGMLPPAAWPEDGVIEDVRRLDAAGLAPGAYRVTAGVYHRPSNRRYAALDPQSGTVHADGEVPVGTLTVR